MSLTHISFISIEPVNKVSPKTNQPYSFLKIQGIAYFTDTAPQICKYDFWPKKGEPLPVLPTGVDMVPVLAIEPDWKTADLTPRIVGFTPSRPLKS